VVSQGAETATIGCMAVSLPLPDHEPQTIDLDTHFDDPESVRQELEVIRAKKERGELVKHSHEHVRQDLGLDHDP
jgi:hypothetical protein